MDLIIITMLPKYMVFTYLNTILKLFWTMKSKQHIPPRITKKNSHQAKDTKMNIDEKGKGKEKEIMIEEGSMKRSDRKSVV